MQDDLNNIIDDVIREHLDNGSLNREEIISQLELKVMALKDEE